MQKKLLNLGLKLAALSFVAVTGALVTAPPAHAAWNAGHIIDDSVFNNTGSMSVQDIQNFLNSKVPTCDTNHPANPAYSQGANPPWTCLKNYNEGGRSAAQIIYDAGQQYSINPQVLLVTLQKENGLITDDWPYPWQYKTAMGFGCPDGAPCDSQWFGFTNQVNQGARHLRNFQIQTAGWTIPHRPGVNFVKYSPDQPRCSGTNVNIVNGATAALYSYTPYQPNAAALSTKYGTGDSCSAYGNRNFYNYFSDWFGSPTVPQVSVIQKEGGDKLYISEAGGDKRWIPSPDVLNAWGLNTKPIQVVSADYFNSLPELPAISRLGSTSYAVYYMDAGTRHWVTSNEIGAVWGLNANSAVRVADFSIEAIPESDPLSRFSQSTDTSDGRVWMMDVGTKHYVPTQAVLNDWGLISISKISSAYLATKTTGGDATTTVKAGDTSYKVAGGRQYKLSPAIASAWGITSPLTVTGEVMRFLPESNGTQFVQAAGDGKVYLIESNTLHYIADPETLANWGGNTGQGITVVPAAFLSSFTIGAPAPATLVQDSVGRVYVIDGKKHYVGDASMLNAWGGSSPSIPTYSTSFLDLMSEGAAAGYINQAQGDGRVFVMENGRKLYIPDGQTLGAWGYPNKFALNSISPNLANKLTDGGIAKRLISNGGDTAVLDGGTRHSVAAALYESWGVSAPIAVSAETLSRFTDTGAAAAIGKLGNEYYIMNNGNKIRLAGLADAYGIPGAAVTNLQSEVFPNNGIAMYLAQSTDPSDGRVFFINQGAKQYIDTVGKLNTLGFITSGVGITRITPASLATIPTNNAALNPLLMKTSSSGIALEVGSGFLAFPDSATLSAWSTGITPVTVSSATFDTFRIAGIAPRLITGSDGKVYFVESGTKRWITNPNTLNNNYRQYQLTRLPDYTLELLPTSSNIN